MRKLLAFISILRLLLADGFSTTASVKPITTSCAYPGASKVRVRTALNYGYRPDGSFPSFDGRDACPSPRDTETSLNVSPSYNTDPEPKLSEEKKRVPLRRWNLNREGLPFGLGLNAEVWNGRVAQVSFVWIFLQELFQGKGVLQSISDEDPVAMYSLGLFSLLMLLLTGRFAVEPPGGVEVEKDKESPLERAMKKATKLSNQEMVENSRSLSEIFNPLFEFQQNRLNFNDGRSPFGFRKNAEIWNGRLAQMSFVWLFFQELILDKGALQSINDGDDFALFCLMFFTLTLTGFAGLLVMESDTEDYVERVIGKSKMERNAKIFENTDKLNVPYIAPTASERQTNYGKVDPKPHPDIDFSFKSETKEFMQSDKSVGMVTEKKPDLQEKKQRKTTQSPFRVEGFKFTPDTKTLIKSKSPHPDGTFRFNDEIEEVIKGNNNGFPDYRKMAEEPRANVKKWPVDGFRFPDNTKSVIQVETRIPAQVSLTDSGKTIVETTSIDIDTPHPDGAFRFTDDTEEVIRTSKNYALDSEPVQPIGNQGQLNYPEMPSVDVVSDSGRTINAPPQDSAVNSPPRGMSSYLDALSAGSRPTKTEDDTKSYEPFASSQQRAPASRGSYLDSLNANPVPNQKANPTNGSKTYANWRQ